MQHYMVIERFRDGAREAVHKTEGVELFEAWTSRWADLVAFEIVPVTSSADAARAATT